MKIILEEFKVSEGDIVKLRGLKTKRLFGHLFVVTKEVSEDLIEVSPITSMSNFPPERLKKYLDRKYIIKDWGRSGLSHESLVSLDSRGVMKLDQIYSVTGKLTDYDRKHMAEKRLRVPNSRVSQKVEKLKRSGLN